MWGCAKVGMLPGRRVLTTERRVIAVEGLAEKFAVEVSIDLRGGNALMAEHFLDGAKVGAAFYEVGGEGMAESMR